MPPSTSPSPPASGFDMNAPPVPDLLLHAASPTGGLASTTQGAPSTHSAVPATRGGPPIRPRLPRGQ
eukprot:7884266-Prorocentrum_lima.AAC.1